MRKTFWLSSLLAAVLLLSAVPLHAAERLPVTISKDSELPLRVLTRPGATLYQDREGTTVLQSNLPTFRSFFVYTRPAGEELGSGRGWYEVGTDDKGKIAGWMKAADLFEWKQTMCLAYTNPEGRHPVLMFDDEEYLSTLAGMSEDKRTEEVAGFYKAIDESAAQGKPLPTDFPIVSMEPKMAVGEKDSFTLLPILEHSAITIDGREARLLSIAAVNSAAKDRVQSDIRQNTEVLKNVSTSSESQAKKLEDMKFDVVWVIDTTRSMGPYIDKAREVMKGVSEAVAANPSLSGKIAFGAWAYRDSSEVAGLEYVTRNFTPELLPIDQFLPVMEQIQETSVDSQTFDEDVFSGVNDAINKTAWRPDALRILILVGDAPGHEAGHKWNASGMDPQTLRALASEKNIMMYTLHLNPPNAKKYNRVAARQFKVLSRNAGSDKPFYWGISSEDVSAFGLTAKELAESVTLFAEDAEKAFRESQLPVEETAATPEPKPEAAPAVANAPTREDIMRSLRAAAVEWLGAREGVEAPRDIEAWVVDKDLQNTTHQSLEVRLLLSKAQLDALSTLLKDVLMAGAQNQVSGEDFFSSLQAASAVAARDPDMLKEAETLGKSGLAPSFLEGLPYKSQLMSMNNELWASWGPDEQDAFLNNLEAKIRAYQAIHDDTSLWFPLNEGDDPSEHVAPVLLELMP
ncbi:MAG: VWA domain-containing protein [Deltaproteobacteria bacterium]|nr:VWA domain-containing protein [Deltaproteobacteria bacterium]